MAWGGCEKEIAQWCKNNVVYKEITEQEIEEIWRKEDPSDDEPIRLNGKYVWGTAKRVCGFINAHESLINITTFGEYRSVMKKVMLVIKEAHMWSGKEGGLPGRKEVKRLQRGHRKQRR